MAGVDRDHLLGLQVHDVHGAIDADQRLAVAEGPHAEAVLQVGHAASLSVDLDTDHRQRLWRRTAGMDDGPGQASVVDPDDRIHRARLRWRNNRARPDG